MTKSIIATIAVMLTIIMSATGAYAARSAISEKTASDSEFFVPVYAENNEDITLGTWDFTEDTAEEVENTDADETTTEASNEIEPDFKRLEAVFPFYNYDRSSKTASYQALFNITMELGPAGCYMSESEIKTYFKGEKGYDESVTIGICCDGYSRYPANKIDAIMRNAYGVEPTHEKEYKVDGRVFCFYDGDYYYRFIEMADSNDFPKVIDWTKNEDGTYTVSVEYGEEGCKGVAYTIKAKPVMIKGKSDWSFISVKCAAEYGKHNFSASNKVSNENNWQNAYKDYLRSKLSEGNDNAYFSLAYIDGDDIPELVYSEKSVHHAKARVLAFSNGELIDLGEYGSSGSLDYYEGKGIIYDYDAGMGNTWGGYYKKSGSNIITLDTFGSSDGHTSDNYSGNPSYTINDEEATEEELNALGDSYSSKYGETVNAGRDYQLTYNNIETYCK